MAVGSFLFLKEQIKDIIIITNTRCSLHCHVTVTMIGAMVIGGDKFSGKPGDWADVKTEIVSEIETAGYSYITKMGAHLFRVAGSGDHCHIKDGYLEKHFKKQMWQTQLRSIQSQVTKSTLDTQCEDYQKFT
jgi:hypothetical protein